MLMIILWTTLAAVAFYYFIVKPYDYWKDRGVPQGRPLWLVGDQWGTLFGKHTFQEMVIYFYNQCPGTRFSGIYQFLSPTLLARDPDLIREVTVKGFDHFADHKSFSLPEDIEPLMTKNLLALKGQKWREMRATLSPSFTAAKMKAMFVLIKECAENFVQHYLNRNEEVISMDMKDTFTRFTNDVIATSAFGVKVDSLNEPDNEFYLMGAKTTNFSGFWSTLKILGYAIFPKLYSTLKIGILSKDIRDFFVDLVSGTIKTREEQGIVRPDMIHLLMEARKGTQKKDDIDTEHTTAQETEIAKEKIPPHITNEDIASQAFIFFFAGYDTVSSALCFTSHEIAVNPEIQDRLREEVIGTLNECGDTLTYDGLSRMKYMDMVISETLRKWPNPLLTDRVCTKPYTIEPTMPGEKPLRLETGAEVWVPIFGLHRDPDYFPDPDRFDPERFSDANKGNIRPYTYFPFGLGPRNCIGSRFALMEMKTVLFYILLHFQLVPVEKTQVPLTKFAKSINIAPVGGFWLGLKRIVV